MGDLHRKGTYEMKYKRNLLPIEKRRFNVDIIVAEMRNLRTWDFILPESSVSVDENKSNGNMMVSSYSDQSLALKNSYDKNNLSKDLSDARSGKKLSSSLTPNDDAENVSEGGIGNKNMGTKDRTGIIWPEVFYSDETNDAKQYNSNIENSKKVDRQIRHLENDVSYYVIRCLDCEFDFNTYSWLDNVSNKELGEPATMKFKINVGDIYELNQYGFFNWILDVLQSHSAVPDNSVEDFKKYKYEKKNYGALHYPTETGDSQSKSLGNIYSGPLDLSNLSFDKSTLDTIEAKIAEYTKGNEDAGYLKRMLNRTNRIPGAGKYLEKAEREYKKQKFAINNNKFIPQGIDFNNPENLLDYGLDEIGRASCRERV